MSNAFSQSAPDSTISVKQYFDALQNADEQAFEEKYEPYFLLILSPRQKKVYQSYQELDERKAYMFYYWKASNPNPLLPENDWLLEFNRRVAYAKKQFPHRRSPYIDDRGKIYIRYGKPRRRFEDSGGSTRAIFFNKENVRGHFKLGGPVNYTLAANETWSYENVTDDFLVHFVKEGTYFREIKSLDELVTSGKRVNQVVIPGGGGARDPSWVYWFWADMVKKRAPVSPVLARAAAKITDLEHSIEFAIGKPSIAHM
ncbi:MAG: GWxTD domain-containing protein, partial [bacterium]